LRWERRRRIEREESEDTPIPQQPAKPLRPAGPRMENMSITQQRQHQQRQRRAEEARRDREREAGQKAQTAKPTYAQQLRAPAPRTPAPLAKDKRQQERGEERKQDENLLEPIKGSIPVDERTIVFERSPDAPQLDWLSVNQIASHVNNILSKVAPPHVRTEKFRVSQRGVLSTTARMGVSAAMLLLFKKELLEAARKGDNSIINVRSNESWVELKILVPYAAYRDEEALCRLREEIQAETSAKNLRIPRELPCLVTRPHP